MISCNTEVSMKLFTSQSPVSPRSFRAFCRGIRNCGSQFQLPRGDPDMGEHPVPLALAILAALCSSGGQAARAASLSNQLPRLDHPRPDAPTGRPRLFRFLPVLALLLGALTPFAAAPATAAVLVSNIDVSGAETTTSIQLQSVAQGFTTGTEANGYTLESIEIKTTVTTSAVTAEENATIKAELWSSSNSKPGSKLADLTVPSSIATGTRTLTFSAPAGTTLQANTEYHVVVYTTVQSLAKLTLVRTLVGSEDSGAASGWSIANNYLFLPSTSTWTATSGSAQVVRIRVNGAALALAAPTGLTVTPGPVVLNLTWTAPSGTVTGYDVHYTRTTVDAVPNDAAVLTAQSASSSDGWKAQSRTATDTTTSHRIVGADIARTTRVRVRAKNSSGVGAWAFSSGTANELGPPTNLIVTPGNGQLTLTWTKPEGDLIRYEMEYTSAPRTGNGAVADDATRGNDATSAWVATRTDPAAGATSHTITGLTNGRTYRLRLRAVSQYIGDSSDVFGTGTPSDKTFEFTQASLGVSADDSLGFELRIRLSEAAPAGGLTFTLTRLLGNDVPTGLCDDGEVKATAADLGASPPATLTVQAGQTEARVYYPVADNGDDRVGRFECFAVQASTAAAGWPGTDDIELRIGTNQTTIAFGEVRPNTAVPDYAVTVLEHIGTVSVPVTVNFLPSSSTTVAVEVVTGQGGGTATEGTNAQNPGDFLIATKSVTFGPSDATRTKMLSVAITDDTVHEQKETIVLRLTTTGQTSYVTQATGGRATLTIQDGLSAPRRLESAAGDGVVLLEWKPPVSNGGSAITGYEVHYTSAPVNTVANDAAVQTGDSPSAADGWVSSSKWEPAPRGLLVQSIDGLTNDRLYRVRVRARNTDGPGPWLFGAVTPRAPAQPQAAQPTDLRVTAGDAKLALVWTAPSGTVTGYEVHYTSAEIRTVADAAASSGNDAAAAWVAVSRSGTAASQTISGLVNGETYRVRVRAQIAGGPGAWAHGTGLPQGTRTVPAASTALPSVSLSVSPNPVTEGSPATVTATLSETRTSATVVPLRLTKGSAEDGDYGTLASITIAANAGSATGEITTMQEEGADADTDDETFTVALGTLPTGFVKGSPASIEVTILDDDKPRKVSLSVSPNPVMEGSGATVTVTLSAELDADERIPLATDVEIPLTYADDATNPPEAGDYSALASLTVKAGALSASGTIPAPQEADAADKDDESFTISLDTMTSDMVEANSAASSVNLMILDDDKPPMAPTGLVVTPRNEKLELDWKQTANSPEVAAVSGYDVHYTSAAVGTVADGDAASGNDASSAWVDAGHSGTALEHSISELVNDTLYRVRIRADNGKGKSEWLHGEGTPSSDAEETAVVKLSLEAMAGTILGSAVSTVSERVESSDQSSQPLAGDADGSSSLLRTLSILFGLPQPGDPSGGVNETSHDRLQAHRAHRDEVASPAGRWPDAARYASGQLRLNSFSFSLDEPSAGASGSGGALVLWGRGDSHSFRGSDRGSFDDELSYSGSWNSVYLGIDQGFGAGRLAGVALSVGRGKVNYRYSEGERQDGRYEARLRSVYPYFSAEVADGTRLWATVGYGRGEISNYRATDEEPGAGDLRLGLAAIGAKHELNEWPAAQLSLVGDAGYARLKVESDVRPLEGLQSKVSRVRAGLEVSGQNFASAPYMRVSARFESGETARRKGLEAEGGIRWSGVRHGAELHARVLRLRGNLTSYRETGVGASVYFRPSSDGTGASLTLNHDWGRPRGSDTLWQNGSLSVTDSQSGADTNSARSLNAELGYGLYSERLLGLVTPKLGWREDAVGERRLRIGAAYRANSWLTHQVGVEFGIHQRRARSGVADYGGDLSASMSW